MSDHSGFKPPDDETGHDDVHDDAEGDPRPSGRRTRCRTGPSRRQARCRASSSTRSLPRPTRISRRGHRSRRPRAGAALPTTGTTTPTSHEFGDSETRSARSTRAPRRARDVFVFDDTTEPPTDPAPAVTPIRTGTRSAPAPAPAPPQPQPQPVQPGAKSTTARKQPAPTNRPGGGGPANTGGPLPIVTCPSRSASASRSQWSRVVLFSSGRAQAMGLVTLVIAAAASSSTTAAAEGLPAGDVARHRRLRGHAAGGVLAR